jgi:hypothetical protein
MYGLIPGRGQKIFFFSKTSIPAPGSTHSLVQWVLGVISLGYETARA